MSRSQHKIAKANNLSNLFFILFLFQLCCFLLLIHVGFRCLSPICSTAARICGKNLQCIAGIPVRPFLLRQRIAMNHYNGYPVQTALDIRHPHAADVNILGNKQGFPLVVKPVLLHRPYCPINHGAGTTGWFIDCDVPFPSGMSSGIWRISAMNLLMESGVKNCPFHSLNRF